MFENGNWLSVTENFDDAAVFVLEEKSTLYNSMSFFDVLEHYHMVFQKGISLRGWIDIKFVRMCYAILNYTVTLLVHHPLKYPGSFIYQQLSTVGYIIITVLHSIILLACPMNSNMKGHNANTTWCIVRKINNLIFQFYVIAKQWMGLYSSSCRIIASYIHNIYNIKFII